MAHQCPARFVKLLQCLMFAAYLGLGNSQSLLGLNPAQSVADSSIVILILPIYKPQRQRRAL